MAFELGRNEIPQFSDESASALESHPWPGNVRELKNVVERAVYRSDSPLITEIVFNPFQYPSSEYRIPRLENRLEGSHRLSLEELLNRPIKEAIRELQIILLRKALKETRFNQRKAAQRLGLTYDQFRGLYRKHYQEIR
jgi:psp operon transcriptional activator